MSLPDLQSYGFTLLGGRMLATPDGAAAMLMYQDDDGSRISFYVRPSTRFDDARGSRSDDGLALRYWYRNGYGFAVVGRADDPRTLEVQQALPPRSEEHTSELQSLMRISYAVFCLKKNKYIKQHTIQHK